ncbi:choline transporter-like 2 [Phymastichus coffea]|uniref:choline transporter-like 2 n=1 Tax=Phymastichus coffea TaxID=108790 RepID=UPI00273ABE75|nr:choline transporter-like 2 [Phymastichus coffea]
MNVFVIKLQAADKMTLDKFFKLPFYNSNKAQASDQPQLQATGDGPLEVKRNSTDQRYLLLFCASTACWVIISIYAFVAGDKIAVDYSNILYHVEMHRVSDFLLFYLSEVSDVLAWDLILSVFLLGVFVALCRWATKVVIYLFIFLVFAVLILFYTLSFMVIYYYDASYLPVLIITIVTTIYLLALYVLKKTGMNMICKVIQESCKAIFAYPSTMCIAVLQFVLTLAAFSYFTAIFGFLYSIRNESFEEFLRNHTNPNDTDEDIGMWVEFKIMIGGSLPDNYRSVPGYIYLLHVINVLCFLWVFSFISGVGRMILTSTFATWYNNKSERRSPVTTVPRSITTILSYHLGTVAYATSIFSWIPMKKVICENSQDVLRKLRKQPIYILSCFTIILNFPLDALAVCAIHGQEFYESASESFKLQIQNIASYLAMNTISQIIIFFGSLLVPFISSICGGLYIHKNISWLQEEERAYEIANAIAMVTIVIPLFLSLTFFSTFHAASESIRLCYFEDSKFSQEGEMKLYEIQVDDFKEDDD